MREHFVPHLNTPFRVEAGPNSTIVELVEVAELRSSPYHESFSLVFRGPANAFLPQGTYSFHHASLGTFELFIVPIGQGKRGFSYQVIFSCLRQEDEP